MPHLDLKNENNPKNEGPIEDDNDDNPKSEGNPKNEDDS